MERHIQSFLNEAKPSQIWRVPWISISSTRLPRISCRNPPFGNEDPFLATEKLARDVETALEWISVHRHGESDPDAIWIRGDDTFPAYDTATRSYKDSDESATLVRMDQFKPLLGDIMPNRNVGYAHAYDLFDLLNVASNHNTLIALDVSTSDLS